MFRLIPAVLALLSALALPLPAQVLPDGEKTEEGEDDKPKFKRAPFSLTGPHLPQAIDGIVTEPRPGVRLRQLDKLSGQIRTVEIAAGAEMQVQRLVIRVSTCRAPEDGSDRGTMAHLVIRDLKTPEKTAFQGWMFAESPALSAMDHPRFDVWVISCTTSEG